MAINLRDLEYLVAVDEEHHFHRAAERCYVSQPTLSGQLKKLEERLGVTLVERSTRQVVMTDVGRAVSAQARRVLSAARGIEEIAQSFHDPMAGELQVGLIPTLAPYLLPQIMPAVKKRFPDLKLWLHEQQTAVLLERLHKAELDLLLLALPVASNKFVERDLFCEPFWLALPKSDPLARSRQARLSDLNSRELMLLEEGHCLREHALDVCLTAGASEYASFHATSLETLRHMVGEGMGITLMPQLSLPRRLTKSDPVQYLPFPEPQPSRRIGMLYRKGSYREEAFLALAETIRETVQL
ncbi:MAG: DNA-binding transcriptional regulator OxyR [Gammaproteobacteria bacterium]|nr:DNA-binding transcriptional regulator OxyR [Gammaproteobacteria bacterium]MCW8840735.1 DNA-binding transcriptional regulator OxyR [Gammaproteobacteria bacterium]MCW8927465.1 DNA-binding transcriptional regulator OxyR [Gammaproteobacteria bacterium]MCW8958378.1 DNA-binding transcriptional regulator OxyR [Gammaproteobacteria bacterium]MCW8972614.1 DNA-binding transcriptional regulator OxyR [Gammaproteobacteria bacterium]